jgi:ferredoxin-thioredoxin reductase catalytic subunit
MTRKLTYEQALEGTVRFSEKYVERGPYALFPDQEVVKLVQEGLAKNQVDHGYRYCP